MQHDQRLRILPFGTISAVRELKLNRKPIKKKECQQRTPLPSQSGPNKSNLIIVKKNRFKQDDNIIFGTCNIQCIHHKELQVSELLHDYSMDFIVLTETWLNSNHSQWKDTTILNRDGWTLLTGGRPSRKGGGLALTVKTKYKPKQLQHTIHKTFESVTWELNIKNTKLAIHGIYHPPPSLRNKTTNNMFVDEFLEFTSTTLPSHTNNIYIGDFNLHLSDEADTDSAIFRDATEAMGLYQHVAFLTHQSGNTLDLVLSDLGQETSVMTTNPGPFITDHRAIVCTLNLKKLKPTSGKIEIQQYNKVDPTQWQQEFQVGNVNLSDKLDTIVKGLDEELTRVVNTLTPIKTVNTNLRSKKPWYDNDMKQHKRQVRKLEKKWLKYKLDSCWIAQKKIQE